MVVVHPVIVQTFSYMFVLLLAIFGLGLLQKGFFVPYIRVRLSFGRLVLVKIRAVNRDHFKVGKIEEGFLVYKGSQRKSEKRISIEDMSAFYRCMACSWIDVDEGTNNICKPNYDVIPGFDSEKYDNLYKRALYKPAIMDTNEKIIIVMLIVIVLFNIVLAYLLYRVGGSIDGLTAQIQSVKAATVTAGAL